MRARSRLPFALLLLLSAGAVAAAPENVVDLRGAPQAVAPPTSFDPLVSAYLEAHDSGDIGEATRTMEEIRRLRVERNVVSLDDVGSRLVARGIAHLRAGEADRAEEVFRQATTLAPRLPEAHVGLARALVRRGPFGLWGAVSSGGSAIFTPLRSVGHQHRVMLAVIPTAILAIWALLFVTSGALALRRARLLLHDLQETFGEDRGWSLPLGVFVTLFALPVILFVGWGFLPLWWMALLFIYLTLRERIVVVLLAILCAVTTPFLASLEVRLATLTNPLFHTALAATEGQADVRDSKLLEAAVAAAPDDVDLQYLLASHLKGLGSYEGAARVYRGILGRRPRDAAATNNLGNIEFAARQYAAAIARYNLAIESGPPTDMAVALHYNLSLAHLQRFEYDAAREVRSAAERANPPLVARFAEKWKYDNGDYAVVDLGLTSEHVVSKFAGVSDGSGRPGVWDRGASSGVPSRRVDDLVGRFAAALLALAVASLAFGLWRGRRAFTLQCARCGVPFCRRCHLGAVVADLCTQCYHLFVVRDGVSGPARNQKLLEVQLHETRRGRVVRLLNVVLPGAGHLYGGQSGRGLVLLVLWIVPASVLCVSKGLVPFSDVPGALLPGSTPLLLLVPYFIVWIVASRMRPTFDVALPSRRSGGTPRRAVGSGEEG